MKYINNLIEDTIKGINGVNTHNRCENYDDRLCSVVLFSHPSSFVQYEILIGIIIMQDWKGSWLETFIEEIDSIGFSTSWDTVESFVDSVDSDYSSFDLENKPSFIELLNLFNEMQNKISIVDNVIISSKVNKQINQYEKENE